VPEPRARPMRRGCAPPGKGAGAVLSDRESAGRRASRLGFASPASPVIGPASTPRECRGRGAIRSRRSPLMSHCLKQWARRHRVALLASMCSFALAACGGDVLVEGRVPADGASSAASGIVPSSGAVPEGSRLVAEFLVEGRAGPGDVIAETTLRADGTYSLSVPRDSRRLIITVYADEAALEAGAALRAGVLDATVGAVGGVRTMHPLDVESTLEASVFAELGRQHGADTVDTVDLRARIDPAMASAWASMEAEAATEATVTLAEAVLLAQRTRLESFAEAGVSVTQEALFEASLEAAAALDLAL